MTTHPLGRGPARAVQAHAFDIQAIIGSGFMSLNHCTYHLLQVDDTARACAWLRTLLASGLVKSVADLGGRPDDRGPGRVLHEEVATVAFTHEGLRALRIDATDDYPFPTPFRMGITHPDRARLIGDGGVVDWKWGDHADGAGSRQTVHVMLAHYRDRPRVARHGPFGPDRFESSASGLRPIGLIRSCAEMIRPVVTGTRTTWEASEPFGFRDGLAQPTIEGLRPFAAPGGDDPPGRSGDDVVRPGEFVLGHLTEYEEPSYCPDVAGWGQRPTIDGQPSSFGLNGSYLAVRQIVQRIDEFKAFEELHPAEPGEPTLVERMVGRRKDGTPLVPCDDPAAPNDFRYRLHDAEGFGCPVGAHIRRANPRDSLGWDTPSGIALAKRHRILRRGRPFGQVSGNGRVEDLDPAQGRRGILFMALNSDLERQFELIQKRWLDNGSFNQYNATDPIVGTADGGEFSVPATPVGRHYGGLAAFTYVIGAGYFFVPGLAALRFIASRA